MIIKEISVIVIIFELNISPSFDRVQWAFSTRTHSIEINQCNHLDHKKNPDDNGSFYKLFYLWFYQEYFTALFNIRFMLTRLRASNRFESILQEDILSAGKIC